MRKFTKLPLNKFINLFFFKRVIINETTKKVSQLDWFLKIFVSFLFK